METIEINSYIEQSRIRSIRTRKRWQLRAFDKKLIRFYKEEKAVRKRIWELGWKELKPPVQRGFVRFFVLRDDVMRTKNAPFFQKILNTINTEQWSHRKDFKKKRRRLGKKIYVVRDQNLREIFPEEFLRKFNEAERSYFYETLIHPKGTKNPVTVYRFIEAWRFVLRVQPNMITKVRVKDLDLERKAAEIDRFFNTDRRYRLWRLLDGNIRWKWAHRPKMKYEDPLRNRSFADILSEFYPQADCNISIKPPSLGGFFLLSCSFGNCLVSTFRNNHKRNAQMVHDFIKSILAFRKHVLTHNQKTY